MNYIDNKSLSELDFHWLRKFKASKTQETLLIQVMGAERKIEQNQNLTSRERFDNLDSINTAFSLRETEIKILTGVWS